VTTTETSNEKFYVNYTILEVNYQDGPYGGLPEAHAHKLDIQSYEGVSKVYLSQLRDPARTLIGAANG
jgi:hypothetical protein